MYGVDAMKITVRTIEDESIATVTEHEDPGLVGLSYAGRCSRAAAVDALDALEGLINARREHKDSTTPRRNDRDMVAKFNFAIKFAADEAVTEPAPEAPAA
jgi:hypothetical protein